MRVDEKIENRLRAMFPGVIIEPYPSEMWIRTNNWHIPSEEMAALREMGLTIDSICTEGDGIITLIIDKESTKKVLRK